MKSEWEKESKEGMRLSHVFLIVLVIHMLVIGGAFAFQYWRSDSGKTLTKVERSEERKIVTETPLVVPKEPSKESISLATPEVKPETKIEESSVKLPLSNSSIPALGSDSTVLFHEVVKGDTLSKIAKHYRISIADLIQWNNLKADKIQLGQKLKIASNKAIIVESPVAINRKEVPREIASPTTTAKTSSRIEKYTVAKGDTLFRIAKKFGIQPQSILEANQIKDANKITIGMTLNIPLETEMMKNSKPPVEASNVAMSAP